jgi:hypothetical protein
MAAAYYGYGLDSGALFDGLAVKNDVSFSVHLNRYDVLFITMARVASYSDNMKESLKQLEDSLFAELKEAYGSIMMDTYRSNDFSQVLSKIAASTGRKFVFLIDEWDCLLREHHDAESQKVYLDWLRDLLKDQPYVSLAFMTGLLPTKKYNTYFCLNMFDDYSVIDPGFTAPYFQPFDNYWNQTETCEALSVYIKMNIAGVKDDVVKMLAGDSFPVMVDTFQNDPFSFTTKDQLYTLLVHLGYLNYNKDEKTVNIPNSEVAEVFKLSVLDAGMGEVARGIPA